MRYFLLFALFTSFMTTAFAEARPKIGLVLSGGGAKGAAHIGALKVLEKNNVAIDYIVGTSIGSYVGGLYALGYSADEIEVIMLNNQWDKGYSDFIPREDLQYADKQLRDNYNITVRLGYSDAQLKMPSGLLLGQSALQLLKLSTDAVGEFASFNDLPIPFRAVATDIVTAKAVILNSGSITQAMKASSAVPGALEPIKIDGKLLVDGGIVNNMPIDVAREMGADIIIAVDIGSPLLAKQDINSTVDVLDQLSNILTITTTNNQKKKLLKSDLLIRPNIDDLSTTDFSIMPTALLLGEQAALENIDKIQRLSISTKQYTEYLQQKQKQKQKWADKLSQPISAIKYKNESKVDLAIITEHLNLAVGDVVNKTQLEEAIARVYALNRFDYVNAEFIDTASGRVLVLTTRAKSWGPDYLHFGFSWQGDFSSDSFVSLDLAYILTDITDNGGQWKNELFVGWQSTFATEFYQPLDRKQDFFSRARLQYREDKFAENKFSLEKVRPELSNRYGQARLGLGYNYTDYGISEIGLVGELGNVKFEDSQYEDLGYTSLGAYLSLGFDTLNSINFPTKGNKLLLDLYWRKDSYDHISMQHSENPSLAINFDWRGALGLGHHTFVGITSLATVLGDNDFSIRVSELGGFLNLSGYQKDALIGAHKVFVAAVYQYDLGREIPGSTDLPLYLGTSIETGNVWALNDHIAIDELVTSGSLYLGTDTSFGPAVIGVGYATSFGYYLEDEMTIFFSLGKNW